jgi:hypothetical protein
VPIGVPARLSWLGIARELIAGSPALPVAAVPVDASGYEPQDTPQFLLDQGIRAAMGAIAGAVPGVPSSAHSFSGPLYPDSGGWWLDNLFGDLSTVPGGTLGAAQPLTAPVLAGATALTVSASLGAVTAGSVICVSDGHASEVVTASPGSTGTVVLCAGTPLRFPHATSATAALQAAPAGYAHRFAVLNSGTGQPPAHTLTDTTGLTAGTGARCYPGAVVTQVTLAGDPGGGWATAAVTGLAQLSQPSAAAVAYPAGGYVPPFAGWQSAVTVGGTLAYAGQWAVTLERQAVVYRNAQGTMTIARGGLAVTGALAYRDPADETPLAQMLTGGLMPVSIALSNGLAGAAALGVTVTCSACQFVRAKPDRERTALGYATAFQATDNSTDTGGSGAIGPAAVTVVNGVASY